MADLAARERSDRPLAWLPADFPPAPASGPAICAGDFLTEAQGAAVLASALAHFSNATAWKAYAEHLRRRIQAGANLDPWPARTAMNPAVRSRREYDGYSVENVTFESVPGYFVTGNLYRPLPAPSPAPAVLVTHGHTWDPVTQPEHYLGNGRFRVEVQTRCAGLARMGAVVLAIDMFAFGDSIPIFGQAVHRQPFAMTIQLWNAMRAVDFLATLPEVDPARIAVTGESGGATQAFFLAALDPRVAVSVPVVMISAHAFGCPCECGLPIHRSADHFANHAMIAALAAPRPMLVISCDRDWTRNTPRVEFPFLREIYRHYGAPDHVANVHLPDEGHDYGPSKRAAMYRFMAARLGLGLGAVLAPDGQLDESRITIEAPALMHCFDAEHPLPAHALRMAAAVQEVLRGLQEKVGARATRGPS